MDDLPSWALWIITAAVGVSPGLAVLSARPIPRLLHRALWARPEVTPRPGREELAEFGDRRAAPRSRSKLGDPGRVALTGIDSRPIGLPALI